MKHIVAFSGGAASAVVAQIVAKEHPGETILLYHSTKTEPADNDRFRKEVAAHIGLPITEDSDGRDIWGVFDDVGFWTGKFSPCTGYLKGNRSLAFCKQNLPCTLYFGYTMEEYDRAQRTLARYESHGILTGFPLLQKGIRKQECLDRVTNCWGLRLPEMYATFEHANCIPCVKGKKAYWGLIAMKYPEQFEKAVSYEEKYSHTVLPDGYLTELKADLIVLGQRYLEKKSGRERQGSLFSLPCECGA